MIVIIVITVTIAITVMIVIIVTTYVSEVHKHHDISAARSAFLGIHYRGVQWEGGAVDGGSIM